MKLLLVLPSSLLTLLLIFHAIRARGARTALYFFASAFLSTGENNGPYIFSGQAITLGRAELPACIGWVFALYLSWCLAEAASARIESLARRVFPLTAFALMAMGCFSDAVETTASGVGWWRWNIIRPSSPLRRPSWRWVSRWRKGDRPGWPWPGRFRS
jgi:hypothetical protein